VNVVDRAWDFIKGWLVSNEFRFSSDAAPFYGKITQTHGGQDEYFVIPQYLDEALEENGFNVKKTFQGLREKGLVVTELDSDGKERTKTRTSINGKQVRCYVFAIATDHIPPL